MTYFSIHSAAPLAAGRASPLPAITTAQADEDACGVGSWAMVRWGAAVAAAERRHRQHNQLAQMRHQLVQQRSLQQQALALKEALDLAETPAAAQIAEMAQEDCETGDAKAEKARQRARDQEGEGATVHGDLQSRRLARGMEGGEMGGQQHAALFSRLQALLVPHGKASAEDAQALAQAEHELAAHTLALEAALGLQAGAPLPQRDAIELQSDRFYRARTVEAVQQALVTCQSAPQWETPEGEQAMQAIAEQLQPQLRAALAELPQVDPASDDSHFDFYAQLMALLAGLQGDWLDANQEVLENFIAFFNELNDIMALIKDAIIETNDKGEYRVSFGPIRTRLLALMNSASSLALGGNFPDEATAKKFFEDLGSPEGMKVSDTAPWQMMIDPAFIRKIHDNFPNVIGLTWMTPARYQAIIAAKDGLMERMNHISKMLAEKYQRTLQQWDTLVKALSSTIDSVSEADRLFISNMAA